MSGGRWQRIEQIVLAALDLPAPERVAFLDSTCGKDVDLRREIESLLAEDADADGVLQSIVGEAAGRLQDCPANHRIGAYKLMREIGRGGMGAVYVAERADGQFQQQVAVKLLLCAWNEDLRERFRRE